MVGRQTQISFRGAGAGFTEPVSKRSRRFDRGSPHDAGHEITCAREIGRTACRGRGVHEDGVFQFEARFLLEGPTGESTTDLRRSTLQSHSVRDLPGANDTPERCEAVQILDQMAMDLGLGLGPDLFVCLVHRSIRSRWNG